MPKKIHENHRERVRDEFLANGFSLKTPPHKILEMLLFYSIPRKDTNEIAHKLLEKFGSIEAVLDATPEELMTVEGIGKNTAAFFKLMKFSTNFYINEKKNGKREKLNDYSQICDYVVNKYLGFTKECIGVTSFDSKGSIIDFDIIAEGDVSEVGIPIRKVMETIIKRNAVAIVLSHNHPNGFPFPSKEDVVFTAKLRDATNHINVTLIDHLIISEKDYVSMRSSVEYSGIFSGSGESAINCAKRIYKVSKNPEE